MSKRNYYRFNQDPWNDEIYKPVKKENDMVDENQVDETQTLTEWNEGEDKITAEDWNAACDHWDMLHDLHGLEGF